MGRNTRNGLCFALFWAKVTVALGLSLSGLFYLFWRVADLHSRAVPSTSSENAINIVNPNTNQPLASCAFNAAKGLARLEAATSNKMMIGYSLDWSYELPSKIVAKVQGHTPPIFNAFMQISSVYASGPAFGGLPFDNNTLNWFGSECGRTGSMLQLTLEPIGGFDEIVDEYYPLVAEALFQINQKYGVPVFLRYAHEMNGNWCAYCMQPTKYKQEFAKMAAAVRARTNMTAMVWGPNVGIAYPFGGSTDPLVPLKGTADFTVLDTNNDGIIDELDNPYTPFYPGDDIVDWVALSIYNFPLYSCYNCAVPDGFFESYLTGSGTVLQYVANFFDNTTMNTTPQYATVHNFYQQFCADGVHNKPFIVPESGAPWAAAYVGKGTADKPEVPRTQLTTGWYNQVINQNTLQSYPKLKIITNYEDTKVQGQYWDSTGDHLFDWRVTNTTDQLGVWQTLLDGFKSNLVQATSLKYGCDGSVTVG